MLANLIKSATLSFLLLSATQTALFAKDAEKVDPAMEAQLKKEKEYRKACKIKMCDAMRNRITEGEDIQCHIIKTLTADDLQKMVARRKLSWPWGKVYCETNLNIERKQLANALADGSNNFDMKEHKINCTIDRAKGKDPYKISVAISPKIGFENGKATKASVGWGSISAPTLAKTAIWPMAKLDNQFNFLKSSMIDTVNGFTTKKCDEVADNLSK